MLYTKRAQMRLSEEGVEDGIYIDLNGDMGLDHKAIEDHIDGNEANAEEIEVAQAAEFDPVEEAVNVIYANEYNYNKILECIGLYELDEAVSGRDAVFNEADMAGLIESAKEFIKKMCEKVAMICKKAILKVASNSKTIQNYVAKNKNAIENGASQLGDVSMSNVSVYTLKKLNGFASKLKSSALLKTDPGLIEKLKTGKGNSRDDFLSQMRDGEVASSMTVKEYIGRMGGITKITNDVTTSLSSEINALYKKFETDSNNIIKELNAQKSSNDGDPSKITKKIEAVKESQNVAIAAMSAYISACLTYINQNVRAISACRSAYKGSTSTKQEAAVSNSPIGVGAINII